MFIRSPAPVGATDVTMRSYGATPFGPEPFWKSASAASETVMPSLTSAAACFRFAGVTRLSAPSVSSLPQRPQFDSSVFQRSYSTLVTGASNVDATVSLWKRGARVPAPPTPTTTSVATPTTSLLIGPPLLESTGSHSFMGSIHNAARPGVGQAATDDLGSHLLSAHRIGATHRNRWPMLRAKWGVLNTESASTRCD